MAMTARGYPTSSRGPGSAGTGTFGTSTGSSPAYKLPTGIPVPTPSNDNVRRVGRSIVPAVRRSIGRHPWLQTMRFVEWYLRTNGDYQLQDINTEGWTLECGSGSSGHLNRLGACPPGPQLQAAADWDWGVVTIQNTKTQVMNFFTNKGPPIDLGGTPYHWGDQTSRWRRTYSAPEELPLLIPGVIPARPIIPEWPVPIYIPHWEPNAIPIAQPVPDPQPIPHRLVPKRRQNPDHAPNTPQRGPGPSPRTTPDDRYAVNPGKSFAWTYVPGAGRNQPAQTERPGRWEPPKPPPSKRVDERKYALTINRTNIGATIGRIFGSATEVIDFIDSMYWAIPKEAKRAIGIKRKAKYIGWDERAKIIWKLRKHIDWNLAFDNLMENELEDRLIGTLGQGSGRLARKSGSTHGFAIGPTL